MTALRLVAACLALSLPALCQYFKITREQIVEMTKDNPFGRSDDGRPKVPDALLEKVRGLTVEEVWTVLPGQKYGRQYAGGFQVLHPGTKLVGRAVTVTFVPARPDLHELVMSDLKNRGITWAAHQHIIDQLQPGDVMVVDLFGKAEGGTVVGDNLATAIKSATVNGGLVVDGGIRDLEGIHPIGMPVYYRHAHPSAIADVTLLSHNGPTRIGEATVLPGDVVFGDRTGLYFIPPAFVQRIVDRAEETHLHDEWTKAKFLSGRYKSSDLYPTPRDPKLKAEYEEFKKQRKARQ